MRKLFKCPDGTKMLFHLADLPENLLEEYTKLIESNGGKVESEPHDKVLKFTTLEFCRNYQYVFDVQFIKDCLEKKDILNINDYFIGDPRFTPACRMSKLAVGSPTCIWTRGNHRTNACTTSDDDSDDENVQVANKCHRTVDVEMACTSTDDSDTEEVKDQINGNRTIDVEKEHAVTPSTNSRNSSNDSDSVHSVASSAKMSEDTEYVPSEDFNSGNSDTEFVDSDESEGSTHSKNVGKNVAAKSTRLNKSSKKPIKKTVDADNDSSECDESEDDDNDSEEASEDLIAWRNEILKDVEQDKDGFPINYYERIPRSDMKILIEFLVKARKIFRAKSVTVWLLARNIKLLPVKVSAEGMLHAFKNHILPHIEDFNLDPKIEEKFITYRRFGRASIKYPITELIQWAEKVTKNIQKDKEGFPEGDTDEFQDWEKQMIINYLLQVGIREQRIDSTWVIAAKLKIFPQHRTKECLKCEFRFNILPNISSFNLSAKDEKEFLLVAAQNKRFKKPPKDLVDWATEETKNLDKDELGFPIGKGTKTIMKWEEEMMVKFILQTKNYKLATKISTWEVACNLKILPKRRTSIGLSTHFRLSILPNIEKYQLPQKVEDELIELRNNTSNMALPSEEMKLWAEEISRNREKDKFGFPVTKSKKYEKWEHKLMIDFLVRWNNIKSCKCIVVWKLACNLKVLPKSRTYSSLRNEFSSNILPFIEKFKLEKDIEAQFIEVQTMKGAREGHLDAPDYLKKWAENITRNKSKDKHGYPKGFAGPYANWEKKIMIDFLIKSNKIHVAKAPTVWELCASLKILPKIRGTHSLCGCFSKNILPHIRDYNLPRKVLEEFLKLNH